MWDLIRGSLVQITEKDKPKKETKKPSTTPEPLGLPEPVRVFEKEFEDCTTWESLDSSGVSMDHGVVMQPFAEGDKLEKIFINMDSSVIKNYRSKCKTEDQIKLADNRYFSTVYFHTLFLYMINKNMKFQIQQENSQGQKEDVDLEGFLSSVFSNYYSEFLMNFEMEILIESISD